MNTIILTTDNLSAVYKNYRNRFSHFEGETKEDYLQWRSEWKRHYAEISLIIRLLKLSRKKSDNRTEMQQELAASYVAIFKNLATFALECRAEAKITANKNYLRMKEVELV